MTSFEDKQEKKLRLATIVITLAVLAAAYFFFASLSMLCDALFGIYTLAKCVPSMMMFAFLTVVSALFARWKIKDRQSIVQLTQEQAILRYAATEDGRPLSILELAANCCLTVEETVKVVERMVKLGACEAVVGENAKLHYAFVGFKAVTTNELESMQVEQISTDNTSQLD